MKKFFTLVVLLATITVAQAQVKFGVKGGLNLTNMTLSKDVVDKSNQTGFFIVPTVKFTIPIVGLGLDASALYDQRSAKLDGENVKQQSIQVPINLRDGVGLGSLASINFFAGPQFGFNVGDKAFTSFDNAKNTTSSWRLKESNLSANVGLGLILLNHLQIAANYNFALGKTGDYNVIDSTISTAEKVITGKTKANSWQLSATYFF